jgi:hypothetical protein
LGRAKVWAGKRSLDGQEREIEDELEHKKIYLERERFEFDLFMILI